MKMQKSVIFVKKYLKITKLKINFFLKLGTIVIIQVDIERFDIAYLNKILLIILLKEFIKLNLNTNTMKKMWKKKEDCDCFLEYKNFKVDLIEYKCLFFNYNYKFFFLIHTNFLTMTSIHLFYCCEKLFTALNEYMGDWKKFNETHYLKRRFLQPPKYERYYSCRLHAQKKSLYKFWYKKCGRTSCFVCSKWYIIVSRCIWELSKYVLKYMNLTLLVFLLHQD